MGSTLASRMVDVMPGSNFSRTMCATPLASVTASPRVGNCPRLYRYVKVTLGAGLPSKRAVTWASPRKELPTRKVRMLSEEARESPATQPSNIATKSCATAVSVPSGAMCTKGRSMKGRMTSSPRMEASTACWTLDALRASLADAKCPTARSMTARRLASWIWACFDLLKR